MKRKYLAVGIILLFIGTSIIPSATSELTNGKRLTNSATIITVDDEPGDADFTSIREAVNYSSPGDTIEAYSGIYREDGIQLTKENVNLLGIDHELGEGNDSGKPFIKPDGNATVIVVEANHVMVSNFRIELLSSSYCIRLGAVDPDLHQNNITISDCIIRNSKIERNNGINVVDVGNNVRIINNEISNCSSGIYAGAQHPGSLTITGNVITDCMKYGVVLSSNQQNVSGNRIRQCENGIIIYGTNNIIYGNDFDDCRIGVYSPVFDFDEDERGNTIIKNNFKNYSNEPWCREWNLNTCTSSGRNLASS